MYGDNRDVPVDVVEKTKYHPHIKSTVAAFSKRFPLREGSKVIDIGCRDGFAVELLTDIGYTAIGTELVEAYVKHAKDRGRNVVFDDIMHTDLQYKAYTYLMSRHCVEHCRDTHKFMKQCSELLMPFGWVFITFPIEDREEFKARDYPGKNHMVYFDSKEKLRNIANKYFVEEYCGKSKRYDIMPVGKEMLYIGHKPGYYKNPHIQGHMLEDELEFLYCFRARLPANPTVVEVGSFLGKSSHAMGSGLMKKFRSDFKFVCIDLFDAKTGGNLYKGFDKFPPLETFEKNMKNVWHETVKSDSVLAADDFYTESVDAIFIDGDHTYDGVMADIKAWLPKVKRGGYMLGHDYKERQFGVKRAVDKTFGNKATHVKGSIWMVQK